ncbi:DEAD/DEAH box helicase [Lactobacillus iners]|uniref:DEAD/DEAH box helicase n=1 Tax=Lactobacillus iners TaxID=147802 RepID=UPI000C9B105B|nr:DEAD/DEAH box helicase [Lactobacillus iners]MDK8318105.1 DEAD/DEAH box helicase [Lactobacillus iners]MDK8324981.1 DEAD/DEAH box helicase [Lactobacillus iners]MDK8582767.1 DEAD/DEAH box helicase [Lactobacillus iners]PMC46912.1 DEAD/DEAH box helicase [Lactobacillus iners]
MLIESASKYYLKKVRAKAKMYEYGVPENLHIEVEDRANDLILLCIGIVGDIANEIWNMEQAPIILPKEKEEELYFVSRFFDSYFQSKMSIEMNPYYILMGAVTYYFCNMNGSSKVMMSIMPDLSNFEFSASGLENVIMLMLDNNHKFDIGNIGEKYRKYIAQLVDYYNMFFDCKNPNNSNFDDFRSYVYKLGNDREILFTDIILAILKKKIYNSCINLMPLYSEIDKNEWIATFKSNVLMKEMWASQILLGEKGIFKGKSGVIQMPTSSGKTTSVALAIQSAFLSKRTSIAIVVAPFRALCKEILFDMENFFAFDENITITEFSDIPEPSEIELVTSELIVKKVFVMTPEKLAYILKHNTEIIESINMIVFDEAHLFDDEARGTDYELLLTTINSYLKPDAQKILVSAVISNAEQLNTWINKDGIVIRNNTIKTSEKTVAFNTFTSTNINNAYSNLYFVEPNKNLEEEFYVPRVVQTQQLKKIDGERKLRYFPDFKNNKQDVGIYYAIKLIANGNIAIFCSKKDTVNNILKRFIDLKERGISLEDFSTLSDETECLKIAYLIREHFGENDLYTAALNGIVGHHSGIPNGVRIAEEYALKKSLVRCVVCTSTLAQGVNLPIKYLIVSSVYQSKQVIKVRDFHNLIGRTARAGKETEGTIILTENIYKNSKEDYKLNKYRRLLNDDNSEECSSNLLKLVREVDLENNRTINFDFWKKYINSRYSNKAEYTKLKKVIIEYKEQGKECGEENFYKMNEIDHILVSLENFILGFVDVEDESFEIIKSTYGYYLANEEEKEEFKNIYNLIKSSIDSLEVTNKLIYRKSMLGILKMKELSIFIDDNLYEIVNANFDELIRIIANRLKESEVCKIIPKFVDDSYVYDLLKMWINGKSYIEIWSYAKSVNLLVERGKKSRDISLEDIITLCDSDFGYASLTIIQAIIEVLNTKDCSENIQENLSDIIYRIRYGLPNKESVFIYELGFADRIISQKIADEISDFDCSTKKKTKSTIKSNREKLRVLLADYPSYFLDRLQKLR